MDKRDYHRVEDSFQVSYKLVTERQMNSVPAADHFELGAAFLVSKDIYELELDALETLRAIGEPNRELRTFLHNVNRRLSLLAGSFLAAEQAHSRNLPGADISGGGISFLSDELVAPGSALAIKLMFTPSGPGLVCYGDVKHCRLTESGENYRVGVQFVNLDETSRRVIERRIIRRQSIERRGRLRQSFDEPPDINDPNNPDTN